MQLNLNTSGLVLKRPVNVKVIVTPAWQDEAQKQLQNQVNQIDSQLAQLEQQGQRAIGEIQKQGSIQAAQQIENINQQVNQKKKRTSTKQKSNVAANATGSIIRTWAGSCTGSNGELF